MESTQTAAPETQPAAQTEAAPPAVPELTLGSGPPAEAAPEPAAAPTLRGRIDKFGVAMGTGRRKTSVARVRIQRGGGKLTINGRALDDYFRFERNRALVHGPLQATETDGKVDIWVRVQGGGTTGQAGAIVLGIARALQAMDPGLHHRLSDGGFLTRDGRMVERKKYGFKKARRSFQFSKR
jgi:small subunit ribosomal protein S9